jgi:hypothetical protein
MAHAGPRGRHTCHVANACPRIRTVPRWPLSLPLTYGRRRVVQGLLEPFWSIHCPVDSESSRDTCRWWTGCAIIASWETKSTAMCAVVVIPSSTSVSTIVKTLIFSAIRCSNQLTLPISNTNNSPPKFKMQPSVWNFSGLALPTRQTIEYPRLAQIHPVREIYRGLCG